MLWPRPVGHQRKRRYIARRWRRTAQPPAEKREQVQAVGRSRGGRTTRIHALTDAACRPLAFVPTGGNVADCVAAEALLPHLPVTRIVHGDKGYESDRLRRQIDESGAAPNIPPKSNRHWKPCFSPALYRGRNAIQRMFGRLKDFRRIATGYDKLAGNFLAAVRIVAAVCCWLLVWSLIRNRTLPAEH